MANGSGTGPARRASDRGRYGRLNQQRVLTTALALVDREGLSALSMRRLGTELGVEAMALYRYASSKDSLLDGLVEALYLELEERLAADGDEDADWRAGLHRIARATYAVCLTHPQAVPLIATRLLAVPLARRPAAVLRDHERVLTLLQRRLRRADRGRRVPCLHGLAAGLCVRGAAPDGGQPGGERPGLPSRTAPAVRQGAADATGDGRGAGRAGRSGRPRGRS